MHIVNHSGLNDCTTFQKINKSTLLKDSVIERVLHAILVLIRCRRKSTVCI